VQCFWSSQNRIQARRRSLDRGQWPAGRQEEGRYGLGEVCAVVASGVDQAGRVDPRLTGREYLNPAAALERETRRWRGQQATSDDSAS